MGLHVCLSVCVCMCMYACVFKCACVFDSVGVFERRMCVLECVCVSVHMRICCFSHLITDLVHNKVCGCKDCTTCVSDVLISLSQDVLSVCLI